MGKLPTIQEMQTLRASTPHIKLTFGREHLSGKTSTLSIAALSSRCQELCAYADTVIFKSANNETVILKSPKPLQP